MKSSHTVEFEQLITEHKSTIYSVCYMFVDTKEETDDLFQEVLINLWKGFEKFRGNSQLRTWVYRVSMNTCISYKRKKSIKTVPLDIAPNILDDTQSESRQTQQLHKRIRQLEPVDRAIVLLWLENLSYDEISAIVGTTSRAVATRLVRIKEKLKSSK